MQTGNHDVVITASAAGFNSAARTLTISDIYLPDLVCSSITAPTNALTGQLITVNWKVSNNGLGAATNHNWYDYVYLATDSPDGNWTIYAVKPSVAALAVGESYTNSASFELPSQPGTFWVIVTANGNNAITELNANNNSAVGWPPITVNPAYRAQLTSVTPGTAASGSPILLQGRTYYPSNNAAAPNRTASVRVLVNDTRRIFPVTSDANGNFSYTFQPLSTEAGDYTACADHPNVTNLSAQVAFTLLGFAALPASVSPVLLPSTPVTGTILLSNLTGHALSGLTFTTPNLGDNLSAQFVVTNTTLPADGVLEMQYTLQSPLTSAMQMNFNVTITSTEGATTRLPFFVKLVPTLAQLAASPAYLSRGMVRGEQSLVSFTVQNSGGTDSGDLTVQIPSLPWMSLGSAATIPSIPAGSNATVTLLLNPADTLPLGLYNGNIAIFNQNIGLNVPYQLRAVSEGIGDLIVNVTDDYTYYVAGEPKVTNATVVLRDPYSGSIIAQTNSGSSGIAQFTGLAEGPYTVDVSAEKHNQFRSTATIVAATTNTLEAFLPRQLVTYQWSVVPTEISDHYRIVLESVFETEVPVPNPVPNVVIEEPKVLLIVAPGSVSQFEIKLTNHGLIAAENVTVAAPYDSRYLVTPLVGTVGIIPALSSVSVPVTVQLRSSARARAAAMIGSGGSDSTITQPKDGGGCTTEDLNGCLPKIPLSVNYSYRCGGNNVGQQRSLDLSIICTANNVKDCWDNTVGLLGSANVLSALCNAISAFLACAGADLTPCQKAIISTSCGAAVGGLEGGLAGAGAGGAAGGAGRYRRLHLFALGFDSVPDLAHFAGR
ncbi:MAG: CARDB domain-containing protein [Limisphaerales bacterium]